MKVNEATPPRLRSIDSALRSGVPDAVIAVATSMGEHILDHELLYLARATNKTAATVFLATLAVENHVNAEYNRRVLGIHRSVQQGAIDREVHRLGSRNVVYKMTDSLVSGRKWKTETRSGRINWVDWIDAIEISMDFDNLELTAQIVADFVKLKPGKDEVTLVAKHIIARRSLLRKTTNWTKIGDILAGLAATIPGKNQKVKIELTIAASESYLRGRSADACLAVLSKIDCEENIRGLYHQASAYAHKKDYAKALAVLDSIVLKMCGGHCMDGPIDNENVNSKKKEKAFNAGLAALAIDDLTQTLKNQKFPPFLVSGTLLGFARHGSVLSHDKDIDVGILGWQNKFEILAMLLETKKFHCDLQFLRESKSYIFPIVHIESGMTIDLFFYEARGDYYVTGIDNPFGYRQEFAFSKFNIISTKFMGVDVFIPEDYELNLAENFGDWKVPDRGYISHLESPSMVEKGGTIHRLVARLFLVQALTKKEYQKVPRILKILNDINDETLSNDLPLNKAIKARLTGE